MLFLRSLLGSGHTLTGRVLINAGWTMAIVPVNMAFGMVQIGLLARLLGPEGIGVLGLYASVVALLSAFSNTSSAETLLTFISRSFARSDHQEAACIAVYCLLFDLITAGLAYGILAALANLIGSLFHIGAGYQPLLIVYGFTMVLSAVNLDYHALLRLANKYRWVFYQALVRSIIETGLLAALYVRRSGLAEVVRLNVFVAALDGISIAALGLIALRQMGVDVFAIFKGWRLPGDVWRFQLLGYGRGVVKSLNRYVDLLLVAFLSSSSQVGHYRVSKQIADSLKSPAQALLASLYPEYSRLWFANQQKSLQVLTRRFALVFAVASLAGGIALALTLDYLIVWVLGAEFLPARNVVLILLLSALLVVAMTPLYSLPAAIGLARPALHAAGLAFVAQAVCMWFLVPRFGAIGAAWANVAYVVIWIAALAPAIARVITCEPGGRPARATLETSRDGAA